MPEPPTRLVTTVVVNFWYWSVPPSGQRKSSTVSEPLVPLSVITAAASYHLPVMMFEEEPR